MSKFLDIIAYILLAVLFILTTALFVTLVHVVYEIPIAMFVLIGGVLFVLVLSWAINRIDKKINK